SFAAGKATDLTVEVSWRRGARSVVRGVKPNREYEIREPPSAPGLRPGSAPGSAPSPEPPAPWFRDVSALLGHRHVETPFPDGARGTVLLVGQSSYESQTPAVAAAVPSVVAVAPGSGEVTPVVPGDVSSIGPLAVADVDGDGTLDLFVGGRVALGAYPAAQSSRLFRNQGGRFVLDEANSSLFRR